MLERKLHSVVFDLCRVGMETEVQKPGEPLATPDAAEDAKASVPNLHGGDGDSGEQNETPASVHSCLSECHTASPPEAPAIVNGQADHFDPETPPSSDTCCSAEVKEKLDPSTVFNRDPAIVKLMESYGDKAKEMKAAIMETLNCRLAAEKSASAPNSIEEEAAKRLTLLKQVIQKNAAEASQSSRSSEEKSNPPTSSPVPLKKELNATRKSPSPMPERLRSEKSPSPASPKCSTPPESAHSEPKKSAEQQPAAAADNNATGCCNSQPRSPCCSMRRSPLRKLGAQEAISAAGAKRKGERAVENVLKILEPHETAEDKLSALVQHYLGFQEGTWQLQASVQRAERQVRQLSREKEQLQSDCNRALLAKSKLEGLCRELQKQAKLVKDECLLRIRDEEEKRREVASKFQTTLLDITAVLEENQARSLQLREENAQLAQRLRALIEHYDVWEKNVDTVLQQKDLQVQVAATHLARVQAQLEQERHSSAIEKQLMMKQVTESQRQTAELATRESNLREELTSHASKYEEFQGALAQSNNLFRSFKQDMDKMTKKIKKLEKETTQWKLRWEASNKALADLTAEKQSRDKELLAAQQRVITLEKLCRALQLERNELSQKVKEGGTTTTTTPGDTAAVNETTEE